MISPVLQYAHVDELEKWRKDHLKAVTSLKELLDTAEAKLNAPVQVSFLNVRGFLQDVEVREAQYYRNADFSFLFVCLRSVLRLQVRLQSQ